MKEADSQAFPPAWYEIASEDHFWFAWRFAAFLRQLADLGISLRGPLRALEIGCGNGVVQRQVEKATSWGIDGADSNRDALAQCSKSRGRVFCCDIHERDPKMAGAYEAVILFDVLEHIQDTEAFLASALHFLKPGGWLFVDVPALPSMHGRFDRAVGHLRRYTRASLTRSLEAAGLEVKDCRHWALGLVPVLALRKVLVSFVRDEAAVVRGGLDAGEGALAGLLRGLMRIEMRICPRPFLGASLLAAAVKTSAPGEGGAS